MTGSGWFIGSVAILHAGACVSSITEKNYPLAVLMAAFAVADAAMLYMAIKS